MTSLSRSDPLVAIEDLLVAALATLEAAGRPEEPVPFSIVAVEQGAALGYVAALQDVAGFLQAPFSEPQDVADLCRDGLTVGIAADGSIALAPIDPLLVLRAHSARTRVDLEAVLVAPVDPRRRARAALDLVACDAYDAGLDEIQAVLHPQKV